MTDTVVKSRWWKLVAWSVLFLLLPIVPFIIWGEQLEPWVEQFIQQTAGWQLAGFSILALLSDILLPIPSSMVATLLGARFPWVIAVGVIWFGQTLGAVVGFWIARWLGEPLLNRLSTERDRTQLQRWLEQSSAVTLCITRPLPILAEATVLLVGASGLRWTKFILPVLASNLGIAIIYATLGAWGKQEGALIWTLLASICVPLLLTGLTRMLWSRKTS